jgi:ribosomal-protein-alanine N-acetyltransferase
LISLETSPSVTKGNVIEPAIESSRLLLVSMGPPVLEALLADDRIAAARLLGYHISPDLSLKNMPLARRLCQLRADPAEEPWLLRAMIDRASGTIIGHIGFHSPPRPAYLAQIAADGVELGYTVHPAH